MKLCNHDKQTLSNAVSILAKHHQESSDTCRANGYFNCTCAFSATIRELNAFAMKQGAQESTVSHD